MIAIQCTQKLLKEVGQEYKGAIIPSVPLSDWHANLLLLLLDRRKCVLFTNDLTRYSFLVAGLKKPDFKMLDEVFRQKLFKCLVRDGFSQEAIEKVLDEIREIVFTRTSDRSVLGTMNDMAQIIKWTVCRDQLLTGEAGRGGSAGNKRSPKTVKKYLSLSPVWLIVALRVLLPN